MALSCITDVPAGEYCKTNPQHELLVKTGAYRLLLEKMACTTTCDAKGGTPLSCACTTKEHVWPISDRGRGLVTTMSPVVTLMLKRVPQTGGLEETMEYVIKALSPESMS